MRLTNLNRNTDYLLAKLEEIHEDVKTLKGQVDDLRLESHGKKTVVKFLTGAFGVLSAVVGWVVHLVIKG